MAVYALTAYPKTITLRDRRQVVIRPLEREDESALLAFFKRLPASERHFLKHDVTSPSVISRWAKERDFDRALALVAVYEGRVVADAVLTRSRHGAYRSVAGVRAAVDVEFRQQGMGSSMLRELCDIAKDADLERVNAELVTDVQEDAIRATEQLGFIRAATIHELLRDEDGRPHDLVVMSLPLGKWYEWWQF
jgi:L-amino acid N-acyltransferase YncA